MALHHRLAWSEETLTNCTFSKGILILKMTRRRHDGIDTGKTAPLLGGNSATPEHVAFFEVKVFARPWPLNTYLFP